MLEFHLHVASADDVRSIFSLMSETFLTLSLCPTYSASTSPVSRSYWRATPLNIKTNDQNSVLPQRAKGTQKTTVRQEMHHLLSFDWERGFFPPAVNMCPTKPKCDGAVQMSSVGSPPSFGLYRLTMWPVLRLN